MRQAFFPYVRSELHAVKVNFLDGIVGCIQCLRQSLTAGGNAQHPAPGGRVVSTLNARTSVKNLCAECLGFWNAGNTAALGIRAGIAFRGEDNAGSGSFSPLNEARIEASTSRRSEQAREVALEPMHQWLGFGITHPNVELKNLWSFAGDHQTTVEKTAEGVSEVAHTGKSRLNNLIDDRISKLDRKNERVAIGTHPTGVGPLVVIKSPLVVLGGWKNKVCPTVAKQNEAKFFAVQEFFKHEATPSACSELANEHLAGRFGSLLPRIGDDDALACSKTVGFNSNRILKTVKMSIDVFQGLHHRKVGCRNAPVDQELLGEYLAALQLGGERTGGHDRQTVSRKGVTETGDQRSFRTYYRQVNSQSAGQGDHFVG